MLFVRRMSVLCVLAGIPLAGSLGAEDTVELAPYVVTATHFPVPAKAYPGSVIVLSPELPGFSAVADLRELLSRAPHLAFRSTGGSAADSQVGVRGFGEGSGDRVLVLVDGLPMNRPDMGGVNWLQVPLGSVERVEILRGGQGVIYGSRAVAGVIKIATRTAGQGGDLDLMAGSHGLRRAETRLHGEVGSLAISGGTAIYAEDGYRQNSAFNGGSVWAAVGNRSPEPGATQWRVALNAGELTAERPGPLISAGFPQNPRRSLMRDQDFFERSGQMQGHLRFAAGERLDFEVDGAVRARERAWNLSGVFADNANRSYRLAPRAFWAFERLELVSGVDLDREELDALLFARLERVAPFGDARLRRESAAAYAHIRTAGNERFSLSTGFRGEATRLAFRYDEGSPFARHPVLLPAAAGRRSDLGWAWTGGGVWQVGEGLRGWLRADRLLRHPLMDEVAAYQGFELGEPFNAALSLERGWQGEAGLAWKNRHLRSSLTVFQMELRDEILFDSARQLNTNFPRTRRRGVELETSVHFGEWSAGAHYTGVDSRYRAEPYSSRRVFLVSPHAVGAFLAYGATSKLHARVDVRYQSAQFEGGDFENRRPKLPAHTIVDGSLAWRIGHGMRLSLAVLNVFDRDYATVKYLGSWYPEPGRTWRTALNFRF